jgi:hypothetical protein
MDLNLRHGKVTTIAGDQHAPMVNGRRTDDSVRDTQLESLRSPHTDVLASLIGYRRVQRQSGQCVQQCLRSGALLFPYALEQLGAGDGSYRQTALPPQVGKQI